jgi:hypothetical protein
MSVGIDSVRSSLIVVIRYVIRFKVGKYISLYPRFLYVADEMQSVYVSQKVDIFTIPLQQLNLASNRYLKFCGVWWKTVRLLFTRPHHEGAESGDRPEG